MLILSQDKTKIVNLENIIGIGTNNNYINIRSVDRYVLNLGEYDTEERAKEVLQEIIKTYKFNINFKYNKFLTEKEVIEMQNDLVYEMPEK